MSPRLIGAGAGVDSVTVGICKVVKMALNYVNRHIHLSFDVDALDTSVASNAGISAALGGTECVVALQDICEAIHETGVFDLTVWNSHPMSWWSVPDNPETQPSIGGWPYTYIILNIRFQMAILSLSITPGGHIRRTYPAKGRIPSIQ
ncbi:hypothetical protein EV424DRAFT_1341046 [Suillus variegatus]|nr:hypothetical protein EV424DRAFT_1341046 [Suillus variegatus]